MGGALFMLIAFALLATRLFYLQVIERRRPDVMVIQPAPLRAPSQPASIEGAYRLPSIREARGVLIRAAVQLYPDRPLYASFPLDGLAVPAGIEAVSNGVAYCVARSPEDCRGIRAVSIEPSDREREQLAADFLGADTLADYTLSQAMVQLDAGDRRSAQALFVAWLQLTSRPDDADRFSYLTRRATVFGETPPALDGDP